MLQLASNIKLIRKLARVTQDEFGEKFNATRAMIASYEAAKASPDELFISRLSKYTGIQEADLLDTKLTEENINVENIEKVFHGTHSLNAGKNQPDIRVPEKKEPESLQELYTRSLQDQISILKEQNNFLRRNFEVSLNSIALATHATNAQLKTLTWFQANIQSGGDPKKTAKVMDTLNSKMAEYTAVGGEADILSGK